MNNKDARWYLNELQYYPEPKKRDYYNTCDFQCQIANVLCRCRLTEKTLLKYKDNLQRMEDLQLHMGDGYWDIFYRNLDLIRKLNIKINIYY